MLDEALYAPLTPTDPPSIGIIPISLSNESVVSMLFAVRSLHEHSANRNVFLPRSPVQPVRSPGNSTPPMPAQKSPLVDSPTVDSPLVDSPTVDSPTVSPTVSVAGPVVGALVVVVNPPVTADPVVSSGLVVGTTCVVVPSVEVWGTVMPESVVDAPAVSSPEPPHATIIATTQPPRRIFIRPSYATSAPAKTAFL
jgi:hypothetical protein